MKKEMEDFEFVFRKAISSEAVPMDEILGYVSRVKGKRLRPSLVLLSARLFGEVNESTRRTALFVEMLHTATLIHDDVVDGSDMRRGQASVNARWDSKSAVLAGDYLLSKAMKLLSDPANNRVFQEMLDVAMAMSEGEIIQNRRQKTEDRRQEEEEYLNIIERKTARLMRACCMGGAISVGATQEVINKVGEFGLNLGMVFQMRDDILDADDPESVAFAEKLLPEYLEKAIMALDALEPLVIDDEALSSLRKLTVFCAERNQ